MQSRKYERETGFSEKLQFFLKISYFVINIRPFRNGIIYAEGGRKYEECIYKGYKSCGVDGRERIKFGKD